MLHTAVHYAAFALPAVRQCDFHSRNFCPPPAMNAPPRQPVMAAPHFVPIQDGLQRVQMIDRGVPWRRASRAGDRAQIHINLHAQMSPRIRHARGKLNHTASAMDH